ncbi:MAG: 50S ribosomal protein L10 [Syntrophomonadaceae bacterium]|nr:50S ribosomal protein L10 [Syntrophomonadaceae bacterium]
MANIEIKKQKVKEIEGWLSEADLIVFTDYRGLNVEEMNELRSKLRSAGAEYKVVKSTLTRFALENAGLQETLAFTEGPNALLFSTGEPVESARALYDFAKSHKNLEVKGGLLEGKIIYPKDVKELSMLPSREVLVAQVLGGLQSPIYGLAYVLKANLSGLARALDAIREQKQAS